MTCRIAMAFFVLLMGWGAVAADILEMPPQPVPRPLGEVLIEMPTRGMSKSQVTRAFGAPRETHAPVGNPRITRWVYERYTVYFEGRFVIHAVLHQNAAR